MKLRKIFIKLNEKNVYFDQIVKYYEKTNDAQFLKNVSLFFELVAVQKCENLVELEKC